MVFRHREYDPSCDVRETPASFFDPLHAKNDYTIDACALPLNAKCPLFYAPTGLHYLGELMQGGCDGLTGCYAGQRVWCNPPFSMFDQWLPWAWKNSDAELITMLAPGVRADQRWWQKWVEPYRDGNPERLCRQGDFQECHIQPPGFEHPTWRLRTTYCAGRVDFLEDGHPIYQKDRKTGEVFLFKSGPRKGKPKESKAMFGCVLLEWRHE